MADPEASVGEQTLDRARKLVALDRALLGLGEPGVLERPPEEVASLEAALLGGPGSTREAPPSGEPAGVAGVAGVAGGAAGTPASPGAAGGPTGAAEPTSARGAALRLLHGERRGVTPAEQAQSLALRSQFRLLRGAPRDG